MGDLLSVMVDGTAVERTVAYLVHTLGCESSFNWRLSANTCNQYVEDREENATLKLVQI